METEERMFWKARGGGRRDGGMQQYFLGLKLLEINW